MEYLEEEKIIKSYILFPLLLLVGSLSTFTFSSKWSPEFRSALLVTEHQTLEILGKKNYSPSFSQCVKLLSCKMN